MSNHPLQSLSRGGCVGAGDLQQGEMLATHNGATAVRSVSGRLNSSPVFSLEVAGSHQYYVGHTEILAHNTCGPVPGGDAETGPALPETQVQPGTRRVTNPKPSGRAQGEVYERTTHSDEYGRQIGQTHKTTHGEPAIHPNPHHHIRHPKTGEVSDPFPGGTLSTER